MIVVTMIITGAIGMLLGASLMLTAVRNEIEEDNRVTIGDRKYETKRIKE